MRQLGCGALSVLVIALSLGVIAGIAHLDRQARDPADFGAELQNGWSVIYTEDEDSRQNARRIVDIGGCAILQAWDPYDATWQLSESRGGMFGGTHGIPGAWCVP